MELKGSRNYYQILYSFSSIQTWIQSQFGKEKENHPSPRLNASWQYQDRSISIECIFLEIIFECACRKMRKRSQVQPIMSKEAMALVFSGRGYWHELIESSLEHCTCKKLWPILTELILCSVCSRATLTLKYLLLILLKKLQRYITRQGLDRSLTFAEKN